MVPLIFLAISAILNIVLDLWFVVGLKRGVAGAAEATVISQYVSGIGIALYTRIKFPKLFQKDKEVLQYIDVLVDGLYKDELHDFHLKWRGSSNQRVIDVAASLKENKIVLFTE